MFRMEIKTGGAAFRDELTGSEDRMSEGQEIKRLLKEVIKKIDRGYTEGSLFDINGNRVGKWKR